MIPIRLPPVLHSICDGVFRIVAVVGGVVAAFFTLAYAGFPLFGGERMRALPPLLARILSLATPLVAGGFLGSVLAKWLGARLLTARCPGCGGAARQEPRRLWGLGYLCSACGARHWAPSPAPWIAAGACALLGIGLAALPFLPIAKSRSLDPWTTALMVVTGLVIVQLGLLLGGVVPHLLSRSALLREADLAKLTVGVLILQVGPATVLAMLHDPPEKFPMGRPVALCGMATFFWAGVWLVTSSLPPSPRRVTLSSTAVALLLTSFGLTAVGASLGGSLLFGPGAVLLLAIAGRLWWNLLTGGRGKRAGRQSTTKE